MPPPEVFEWLQEQPPSSVVIAALAAYDAGPLGLSAHLLHPGQERALEALAAAARPSAVPVAAPAVGKGGIGGARAGAAGSWEV